MAFIVTTGRFDPLNGLSDQIGNGLSDQGITGNLACRTCRTH